MKVSINYFYAGDGRASTGIIICENIQNPRPFLNTPRAATVSTKKYLSEKEFQAENKIKM